MSASKAHEKSTLDERAISPRWPNQLEYQEAIEFPSRCFADAELKASEVGDRTPFGMPLPITGQFTNVYRMVQKNGVSLAVRLFLRDDPERERHWNALATHLNKLPSLPLCLAPVEYQREGFCLRGRPYPLVKMPWLRGIALNAYIEKNLYDAEALKRLAANWRYVIKELEAIRFIHGDLQHGNVLVEEESETISFVDYDASFVPALAGVTNREAGHPSYQHPKRSPADYGPLLDRFSALAIYSGIRALASAPELWYRLDNGDNLLFQREDFADPERSRAFSLMMDALRSYPAERQLVMTLRLACEKAPTAAPPLDRLPQP